MTKIIQTIFIKIINITWIIAIIIIISSGIIINVTIPDLRCNWFDTDIGKEIRPSRCLLQINCTIFL